MSKGDLSMRQSLCIVLIWIFRLFLQSQRATWDYTGRQREQKNKDLAERGC